jgi:hypothetical protein
VVDAKSEWTHQAIDVMRAWSRWGGTSSETAVRLARYVGDESATDMKLSIGFINLTAILLLRLQHTSGLTIDELLQEAADVAM